MSERAYLNLLQLCLDAPLREERTGTGARSIFGHQMRFDLTQGFPLLTTKKVHFKSVVAELLWFLSGSTNVKHLQEMGCTIWDEWADEHGDLGRIYGHQWRRWNGVSEPIAHQLARPNVLWAEGFDQIKWVISEIKTNPTSRRLIVNAWNPSDHCKPNRAALPPCHVMFQFFVQDGKLSCQLYQRSADVFLGVPFNIASYALLTHLVARECGLDVGEFIWTGGDCHLYENHVEQAELQLERQPHVSPFLNLNLTVKSVFDFGMQDVWLTGYSHYPAIKADVSV